MEMWIVYEAAARGIARARSGEDRKPTDTEREWAKAAIDAAQEFIFEASPRSVTG